MLKILIVTNSYELNNVFVQFLRSRLNNVSDITAYTFDELDKIIPREILEANFIITEAYRVSENSIDDYGLDMFLNFLKRNNRGILIYWGKVAKEVEESEINNLLFRVPNKLDELEKKIKYIYKNFTIKLTADDQKALKKSFPFRVIKNHHCGRYR